MSMIGEFREISEALLNRLRAKPALVDAVVLADLPTQDVTPDFEALVQSMPARQREMMRAVHAAMTPEQRSKMEAMTASAAATLRGVAADLKSQTGGEEIPRHELGQRLSIEKAWHGVHYLLCGSVDEAPGVFGRAILGGTEIGHDRGYGPARCLTPPEVQEVADALSSVSTAALLERYDAETMDRLRVYPGNWSDPENREWLIEAFREVVAFYAGVARRGNAVLVYLT